MPNSGEHEVCNPEFVPDDKWKKLREYVYSWVLAKVGQEHYYLRGDPKGRAPGDQHRTAPNAHPTAP